MDGFVKEIQITLILSIIIHCISIQFNTKFDDILKRLFHFG